MRDEESFAANALTHLFAGASFEPATQDPPDFWLLHAGSRMGVEVSQLFEQHPAGGSSEAFHQSVANTVRALITQCGHLVPSDVTFLYCVPSVTIALLPGINKIIRWFKANAASMRPGQDLFATIDGFHFELKARTRQSNGTLVRMVASIDFRDVESQVRTALRSRFEEKSRTCNGVPEPVWLAIINQYALADRATIARYASALASTHWFDKVFLVDDDGALELAPGSLSR